MILSVIIPSYNRYDCLIRAINSVLQTGNQDLEIVVVNDCSDDPRYYQKIEGVTIVHLEKNTAQLLGFKSDGFTRNCGIRISRGKYLMFLDDDDIFLPDKVSKQLKQMIEGGYEFSATDAYYGSGPYEKNKRYSKYNEEHYFAYLSNKMGFTKWPNEWDYKFLSLHNSVITSTVCVKKSLFIKANRLFREDIAMGGKNTEGIFVDYECWQNLLLHTKKLLYINEPLVYYDSTHGGKQHY